MTERIYLFNACCPVLPTAGPSGLFAAYDAYLTAKRATANRERTVAFDEERLAIVKDRLGDVLLSTITRETIEGFQAKRKLDGVSNRTVNTDVGALRKVLKRYGHWRRLQDHVTMLSEAEGEPIARGAEAVARDGRQESRVEHVYCAAVLTANTSMRGVEVKHVRRSDVDPAKVSDIECAMGKGVLYVGHSKNETSKRKNPLNGAARDAITRMLKRADALGIRTRSIGLGW